MKRYSLLVLTICSLSAAFSQTGDQTRKKFGVRLGANYSLMNFNKGVPQPATAVANSWKPGVDFRLLLNVNLRGNFALQPEYAFLIMNGKDERTNTTYQLSYLSLPLLLRIPVTSKFVVLAGPQFDLLVQANQKVNGSKTDITHDTEERNISGVAGLECALPAGLFVDLRYVHGFNHVGIGQRSATKEFKWQSVSVGIGFRF